MNKYVLDSSAWIEYLAGTPTGELVVRYITEKGAEIYTTGLIVAEVLVKFLREEYTTEEAISTITAFSNFIPYTLPLAGETSKIYVETRKQKNKFSLADAHILATARALGAKVITCDSDFLEAPETIYIAKNIHPQTRE